MTTEFSLTTRIDEGSAILWLTASGPIDSPRYIDESLAFFDSVPTPWVFDRINDLRTATGFVAYEDLSRMAAYWARKSVNSPRRPKVAVITPSKLVAARMPIVHGLNPSQEHRAFEDIEGALAWIGSASSKNSPF